MKRVVSLIASATEIVHGLGCGGWLVGRSHECDYPPEVAALPVLTAPKFPVDGTSYEIDQRVKAILAEGLAVYRVDAEALRALAPDVIVTQDQCEVCAVSLSDVQAAVCDWTGHEADIVSCRPDSLAEVWSDIRRVGDALGVPARADALVASLQARMNAIAAAASRQPARPRVALIEWLDPLMAAGNWMPELVDMAGGVNLFGEAGKHSPWMTWEELRAADPDVIITLPCGMDIEATLRDFGSFTARPGFSELKALRNGSIYVCDGNQYFNRPGPRLAESLEILAEILHPQAFDFGHRGRGWIAFDTHAQAMRHVSSHPS